MLERCNIKKSYFLGIEQLKCQSEGKFKGSVYCTVPPTSYAYDNNGNTTDRGSQSIAWDAENRPTSVSANGTVTTFIYDGDDNRVRKTENGETRAGDVPTDKKFTGQRLDDTGLYYYGARYYDPTIGRFISPDTIVPYPANPQAFNRYSYVLNNPMKYVDPSGHFGEEEIKKAAKWLVDKGGEGLEVAKLEK